MKAHNQKIQGSLQIIIKTAGVLNQILPWTIAIFAGGQLIVSLQPYLTVFLSARVVDLLSAHAEMKLVIALIVISGASTYTLIFLGKYFDSKRNVKGLDLYWAILWRMNRVLMKCPYSEVEKTKIRTQQEEIIQAYRMSGYGPWKIPEIMMELISGCVMIIMSIVMGGAVFLPVQGESVPWATVVMLALTVISVIVSVVSQRQLLLLNQQSIGDMGKIFMKENYLLSYMDEQKAAKDIRIYQQQNEIIGQLASAFGVFHTFIFQRGKKEARNLALRSCCAQLLTAASYVIVCVRAVNGVYSIGAVVQYVGAVVQLSEGIRMLASSLQMIQIQAPFCKKFLDFIEIDEHSEQDEQKKMGQKMLTPENVQEITFDHVYFSYKKDGNYVLRDISFSLHKGEHIAMVGMNGSGKTTCIKLLCRLLEPDSGTIYLDGTDIREYTKESCWKLFSAVFQDFQMFALPIGENIAGSTTYSQERIMKSLDDCGMGAWIKKQNKGLSQELFRVNEDGINVSGGESQKLAIARALYFDRPFIIMDEPTAALDPVSESEIYEKFHMLAKGKGAVYISHRLSSCRFCNQIYVFDNGELIQKGTHEELVGQKDGKYRQLWQAQAEFYEKKSSASQKI